MENLSYALTALLPIIVPIIIGFSLREMKVVSAESFNDMNLMVFKILLPLQIFLNLAKLEKGTEFPIKQLAISLTILLAVIAVGAFSLHFIVKKTDYRAQMLQQLFRSNLMIIGLPLAALLLSPQQLGIFSIMIAFFGAVMDTAAVLILSVYKEIGEAKEKIKVSPKIPAETSELSENQASAAKNKKSYKILLNMVWDIIKNPLIMSAILGIIFYLLPIELPKALLPSFDMLGRASAPVSLLALGGRFYIQSVKKFIRFVIPGVIVKQIIIPALALYIAFSLNFSPAIIISYLMIFGTPPAISNYPTAVGLCKDSELTAQLLVFSTVFSFFTLFIFIAALKSAGIIV